MPDSPKTIYRTNPAIKLHWACWNDEYVVFEECSGQTHQIDPSRAYILNTLYDGPKSFDALHTDLAGIFAVANSTELPELLKTILDEFNRNGLVEEMY